jgi:hypothetical protein
MRVKPAIADGEWLKASQAAWRLGVGVTRIHSLVRQGRLSYVETPNGRLFDPDVLDALRAELDAWPGHSKHKDAAEGAA